MFSDFNEHRSGGYLQTAATVIAVAISALASFQFFATYSGALLAGLVPDEFLAIAAGLIGGLIAQNLAPWQAACLGVYAHGLAADRLVRHRKISSGLLASEVAAELPATLHSLQECSNQTINLNQ